GSIAALDRPVPPGSPSLTRGFTTTPAPRAQSEHHHMPSDLPLELLNPDLPRGRFRFVLFDFDGTLSLLREDWPAVMTAMMVEELRATGAAEPEAEQAALVEENIMRLNGLPTVHQMNWLAGEVRRRG